MFGRLKLCLLGLQMLSNNEKYKSNKIICPNCMNESYSLSPWDSESIYPINNNKYQCNKCGYLFKRKEIR